jgi:hypothetical protein
MAVERQPPDVLAMIIADSVHKEFGTNKIFINGTYSVIGARDFPHYSSLVVYAAITGGHGPTVLKMRLVDVNEERAPLYESEMPANFPDPIVVAELVFGAHQVVFPEPGEYRLQLFAAGEPLRERRLHVVPIQQPPLP